MIHGFQGNNQNYLASDIERLVRDHAVLFYDQRGGGRSEPIVSGKLPGLSEHVADLEALRSGLQMDRLTLLAHSGGAYIAVQYALRHPERVERMALVSPGPPSPEYAAETVSAFRARLDSAAWAKLTSLHTSLPTSSDPAEVCRELSFILLPKVYLADASAFSRMQGSMCDAPDDMLRTEGQRLQAFRASVADRDWMSDLPSIRQPVIVIHGARDAIPLAAAEAWVAGFQNANLAVLSEADHFPWLDQPAAFADVLTGFLGRR